MSEIKFKGYTFYETGGSIVLTVPAAIVDSLMIKDGDEAVIWVDDLGRIVIEKKKRSN